MPAMERTTFRLISVCAAQIRFHDEQQHRTYMDRTRSHERRQGAYHQDITSRPKNCKLGSFAGSSLSQGSSVLDLKPDAI